jgi:phosphocarrier protein
MTEQPEQTVTRTIVVTDPVGLHARTAVGIADVARRSKSKVTLTKDERQAAGTEVLQLLSLYVPRGESVVVQVIGPDAAEVMDALEPVFAGEYGGEKQKIA